MTSAPSSRSGEPTRDSLDIRDLPRPKRWVLEVGSPVGGQAQVLRLGDRLIVGSGSQADLRIDDPAVSQRHCAVRVASDRVEIEDLSSKNGVHIGAVRVARAFVSEQTGAFVIGRTSMVVRAGQEEDVPAGDPVPGLVGTSVGMRRVAAEVRRYARTRAPVLLQGESGTGKDVVARALHQLSRRAGNYVPLNVGALPESLADGELFGHRRGAFTGAVHSRAGAFEQANGGSLFLDEIADLSLAIQVKLLRVVEDGSVRPLGATQPLVVDVRVISASWADLAARVADERFRADLYHRLSTVVLRIPPLRERRSDIPELSRVLLRRLRDEVGEKEITSGALSTLLEYDWPGNVRELGSVLYRAAMASSDALIRAEHIRTETPRSRSVRCASLPPDQARSLLEEHAGNVSAAARAAGVARSTFRSWLARSDDCAQNSPTTDNP